MDILVYIIFLTPTIISLYSSLRVKIVGSDQVYHLLMIEAIKENGNSLIVSMPFFIGKNRHSYPQLLHWIFSYVEKDKILRLSKYFGAIGHFLSGIALYIFIHYYYFETHGEHISSTRLIYAGLIYACCPINYDLMNAKNMGFSARGIGLFLGQIFTYLTLLSIEQLSIQNIISSAIIISLIILTNVFAFQYVILFTIISTITFQNLIFLIPLFGGITFVFILNKKVASNYFIGQFYHKKLYSKYLAQIFILKLRPSVWGDFINGFYLKFKLFQINKLSLAKLFHYISTNPMVNLISGIPFLLVFVYLMSLKLVSKNNFETTEIFVLITLFVFILISFRKTRFLGEPERYVEFSIGILAFILSTQNNILVYIMCLLSIAFILFRIYYFSLISKAQNVEKGNSYSGTFSREDDIQEVAQFLKTLHYSNLKVICNLSESSKYIMSSKYQIFRHPLFQEYIGPFHFHEIYNDDYFMIRNHVLIQLIDYFKIHILVFAKNEIETTESLIQNGCFKEIYSNANFVVLQNEN